MFKMTLREALKIQAEQVAYYGQHHAALDVAVALRTDTRDCDLDAPMDMIEVNRRVPRGAEIEWLCGIDNSNLD